ncbi:hypothetical protein ACQPZ2_15805 [Nocardia pseudovaccinii]|uniref:hypothetical protein n=1 Tax=Nocardia pseudovaccinii TaxID=189540 RepID=UPI003D8BB4A0
MATTTMAELAAAGFEDAVELGRGGFGVVDRCCQVALDRTAAADVYALGATLFCALTGHTAFRRRRGENGTQFPRITAQPMPDLRDSGIPDDVSVVVPR